MLGIAVLLRCRLAIHHDFIEYCLQITLGEFCTFKLSVDCPAESLDVSRQKAIYWQGPAGELLLEQVMLKA